MGFTFLVFYKIAKNWNRQM